MDVYGKDSTEKDVRTSPILDVDHSLTWKIMVFSDRAEILWLSDAIRAFSSGEAGYGGSGWSRSG